MEQTGQSAQIGVGGDAVRVEHHSSEPAVPAAQMPGNGGVSSRNPGHIGDLAGWVNQNRAAALNAQRTGDLAFLADWREAAMAVARGGPSPAWASGPRDVPIAHGDADGLMAGQEIELALNEAGDPAEVWPAATDAELDGFAAKMRVAGFDGELAEGLMDLAAEIGLPTNSARMLADRAIHLESLAAVEQLPGIEEQVRLLGGEERANNLAERALHNITQGRPELAKWLESSGLLESPLSQDAFLVAHLALLDGHPLDWTRG